MRRVLRHLGLASLLTLLVGCGETSVVLAIHSYLEIPDQLDAICLQVVAGGAWEFGRRYPLAAEHGGGPRTLSVLAGESEAQRFEVLLRGERRGWLVSFQRVSLLFHEHEVVTEDLYLPICSGQQRFKPGTGNFPASTANGTLASGATSAAAVPVAFAPNEVLTTGTDARRFAWRANKEGGYQVMQHEQGTPTLTEQATRLLVADIDNDCDLDLVVLKPSCPSVWRQIDGGVFEELPNSILVAEAFSAGVVADFNRDGHQDLVLVSPTAVRLLLNDPASPGRFGLSAPSVEVQGGGIAAAVGLLDSDENPDVVLVRGGSTASLVLASLPGDGITKPRLAPSAIGLADKDTVAVGVADLNGDGVHDLAFASGSGPSTILLNKKESPGAFEQPAEIPGTSGTEVHELHLADLDNDCRPDLVLGTKDSVRVLLNGGGGLFVEKGSVDPLPPAPTTQIVTADIDGDGLLDLVMVGGNAATYHLQAGSP